ncbi:chemotaxis protein CheW [Massilia sp. GER05]|uniref:chemotaxis protein CheW n=1 Tax=unclassified Massilia TaxID=2609279 RepID=UPI0039A60102
MDVSDAAGQKGAARRARLRQYQEQLLERMQAARTSSGARAHQLGVEIGGVRYLLDLVEAGEIVPLPPLAAVPLTQPWYLGLANVRGNLLGVVDLARYLDPEAAPTPGTRLVTFGPALGFPCALLVAKVVGLREAGGQDWTPLSLAALAREERFLQVAR